MGIIRVNIDAVLTQDHDAVNAKRMISDVKSAIDSLSRQMDPKILARNNINTRLRSASAQLSDIHDRVARMQNVVEAGASSYYSADMNASQRAKEISRNI